MGWNDFWEQAGKNVGSVVKAPFNAIGSAIGGDTKVGKDINDFGNMAGGGVGYVASGGNYNQFKGGGDGPPPPGVDPAIDQVTQAKQQQAQDFRSGMPHMEKGLNRQYALQSHNQLAQQLQAIRRDASQRGIMNSGVGLGNQAAAQAESAGNVSKFGTQVHSAALGEANQLDQDAINAGIQQTQIQQSLQDSVYNQALKNLANSTSGMASMGQGVGGLIGSYVGSKSKTGTT